MAQLYHSENREQRTENREQRTVVALAPTSGLSEASLGEASVRSLPRVETIEAGVLSFEAAAPRLKRLSSLRAADDSSERHTSPIGPEAA